MDKPKMNEAKVKACIKKGGTRAKCMKEAYPDKKGGDDKGKKKPARSNTNPFA